MPPAAVRLMRITFLAPHVRIAGGVRAILTYADRLAGRGHDVTLVVPTGSLWRVGGPRFRGGCAAGGGGVVGGGVPVASPLGAGVGAGCVAGWGCNRGDGVAVGGERGFGTGAV